MSVIYDSSGGAMYSSATQGNLGKTAVMMMSNPVNSTVGSTFLGTAGDNTLISSVTGQSIYVYAITFGQAGSSAAPSAGAAPQQVRLQSGTTGATAWWYRYFPSTGAMAGISVSVPPPSYLFRTAAAALLNCNATSSGVSMSVSAFIE